MPVSLSDIWHLEYLWATKLVVRGACRAKSADRKSQYKSRIHRKRCDLPRREHRKEMKKGARIDPRKALLFTNQAHVKEN